MHVTTCLQISSSSEQKTRGNLWHPSIEMAFCRLAHLNNINRNWVQGPFCHSVTPRRPKWFVFRQNEILACNRRASFGAWVFLPQRTSWGSWSTLTTIILRNRPASAARTPQYYIDRCWCTPCTPWGQTAPVLWARSIRAFFSLGAPQRRRMVSLSTNVLCSTLWRPNSSSGALSQQNYATVWYTHREVLISRKLDLFTLCFFFTWTPREWRYQYSLWSAASGVNLRLVFACLWKDALICYQIRLSHSLIIYIQNGFFSNITIRLTPSKGPFGLRRAALVISEKQTSMLGIKLTIWITGCASSCVFWLSIVRRQFNILILTGGRSRPEAHRLWHKRSPFAI